LHLRFTKEGTLLFVVRTNPVGVPLPGQSFPPAATGNLAEGIRDDQAKRDLNIGKFYQNSGHSASAIFYYEIVQRRYPNTAFAAKATQLLQELRTQIDEAKPAQRIGQIIIVGNEHLPDGLIREQLDLYPGVALVYPELKKAEDRLNKIKEPVKIRATIIVLDPESTKEYKDLLVQITETVPPALSQDMKKLEGAWVVQSATLEGQNFASIAGAKITFSRSEVTTTIKGQTTRASFLLNPATKEMRWFPSDGPDHAQPSTATYAFKGDDLQLRLYSDSTFRHVMELTLKRKSSPEGQR
jgi:uncharacterized protein (TIGR03067 family)